ncbi:MAG TPA: ABC transporter ATP-binding protein [Candidatus Acidoferrales bacterium]|nr:ABC transporter ATP-binding protein [Candidatus Acidoferrales bacterium]
MLEVRDLHVHYGAIHALKGVSLTVNRGEIVTLLGANGAGKTTTLRTICGLLRPSQGTIEFDGARLEKLAPHEIAARGVAHVPEGRRVFPRLTVWENLQMGAYLRSARAFAAELEHVFKLFPRLKERSSQTAGTLSGGEQQMLAIARALMARPKLLLLDEPSMGLAPLIVERIFETIRTINREGITVLLVEQNAAMALNICERGYVLETGAIALQGAARDLAKDDRVRAAYLGG